MYIYAADPRTSTYAGAAAIATVLLVVSRS